MAMTLWLGRFPLGSQAEERQLPADSGQELHFDRQSVSPMSRYGHGWLAGGVGHSRERRDSLGARRRTPERISSPNRPKTRHTTTSYGDAIGRSAIPCADQAGPPVPDDDLAVAAWLRSARVEVALGRWEPGDRRPEIHGQDQHVGERNSHGHAGEMSRAAPVVPRLHRWRVGKAYTRNAHNAVPSARGSAALSTPSQQHTRIPSYRVTDLGHILSRLWTGCAPALAQDHWSRCVVCIY